MSNLWHRRNTSGTCSSCITVSIAVVDEVQKVLSCLQAASRQREGVTSYVEHVTEDVALKGQGSPAQHAPLLSG